MIFALAKFSAVYKAFNRRALTERDFFRLCRKYKIEVHFEHMPILQGCHAKIDKKLFIYIDKNLKGIEMLFVAFHELAHALLHESTKVTEISFFNQFVNRNEDEAEAVALVALFPTKVVECLESQIIDEDVFLNFLIKKRLLIYQRIGI